MVIFHSDGVINGQGYKLVFSQVPQGKINVSFVLLDKWKVRTRQKKKMTAATVHG